MAELAERLRTSVSTSVQLSDGSSVPVTASVGFATADRSGGFDSLLRRADRRMYEDKASSRNGGEAALATRPPAVLNGRRVEGSGDGV